MEVIHRLPKQLKWDSFKTKGSSDYLRRGVHGQQIKRRTKQKAKERVKANPRVHLFLIREKEKVEKVKERINQRERTIMLVEKLGIKELPLFPSQQRQRQAQRLLLMGKRSDQNNVSIMHHQQDVCVERIVCIYIKTIQ